MITAMIVMSAIAFVEFFVILFLVICWKSTLKELDKYATSISPIDVKVWDSIYNGEADDDF